MPKTVAAMLAVCCYRHSLGLFWVFFFLACYLLLQLSLAAQVYPLSSVTILMSQPVPASFSPGWMPAPEPYQLPCWELASLAHMGLSWDLLVLRL